MLVRLLVENVALAEHVELDLEDGFTVLTGETGAGKSLVIDALALLQGGRGATDMIRTGTKAAVVEATFRISDPNIRHELADRGIELEHGELVFRRVLNREGRHRSYLNGAQTPATRAGEVAARLFEVHGQHEQQRLLKPAVHLQVLDEAAGLQDEAAAFMEGYDRWRRLVEEEASLARQAQERARRLDFLRFQLEELERIAPQPGEWEELEGERKRLENADRLTGLCSEGEYTLYSADEAVAPRLKNLAKRLGEAADFDARFSDWCAEADELAIRAEELARGLGGYGGKLEADPARLDAVNARLDALGQLRRKYGELESLPEEIRRLQAEYDELETSDAKWEDLSARRAALEDELVSRADALHRKRLAGAPELARQIERELRPLGMDEACIDWHFGVEENLTPRGRDQIELLLSANRGEPARPLHKVASGGELSRVMLALHTVALRAGGPPCVIFDEIDAGIGGEVGHAVGTALRKVATARQILCVTHLPQIAVFADAHWTVSKKASGKRTVSELRKQEADARLDELGRMLGGRADKASREHARVLLARALEHAGPLR